MSLVAAVAVAFKTENQFGKDFFYAFDPRLQYDQMNKLFGHLL